MFSFSSPTSSTDTLTDDHAPSEPVNEDVIYARCDPGFAKAWLDRSGLDITQVARMSCLSVAQVRQLLQGTDASFYSTAIKQRAYRRVLALLGAPEPAVVTTPASAPDLKAELGPPQEATFTELTVHQSLEPEQTVSLTVDTARRGPTSYTVWAWLGLALLLGAATAQWWHGWLSVQARALQPQVDVRAPAQEAPPVTAPAEAAPQETPAAEAQAAVASTVPPCVYVAQPATTVMPALAEKPGNYVYVQARSEAEICVIDGEHKITHLQLKAGEHRSVYGSPPWQLSGLDLSQLNIYFQGWRVLLPEMATQQVALVERSR